MLNWTAPEGQPTLGVNCGHASTCVSMDHAWCHQSLRPRRYEVVPTPLTRLRWWRVVLDEAQMVESSTAKATEMALKLDTVHRWGRGSCVGEGGASCG